MAVNRLQISPVLCSFGYFKEFKEHLALKKSHRNKSAFILYSFLNAGIFCTKDQVLLLNK